MKLLIIFTTVMSCRAQSPAFEAASVKLSSPGEQARVRPEPGRLTITNFTLRAMVRYAYNVRDIQISGGPGWFDSDHWDIVATAGREISREERSRMLQTLLTERFQMTIRHEMKELPIYALMVAKSGLKMKQDADGNPERISLNLSRAGLYHMQGENVTVSGISEALFGPAGRIVVDRTGISGKFDYNLEWVADPANLPMVNGSKIEPTAEGPSIFTALQEQLGLKLESAKGPVEILVIDRAEKATEN